MSIEAKIESLLFLSGRPMSARELAELTKDEVRAIEEAGEKLIAFHKERNSGVQIIKNGASFQMVTAPENAALAKDFVKDETTGEMSRPSLETLTIIAYRGPVSKTDLDRIRGINCSLILRNLLLRGLIEARENKKIDETYYTVTFDFLRFLGLNEIKELPDYEKLSQDDTIDRILEDNPLKEKIEGVEAPLPAEETIIEEDDDEFDDEDEEEDDDGEGENMNETGVEEGQKINIVL